MLTAVVTTASSGQLQVQVLQAETCERTDLSQAEIDQLTEENGEDYFTVGGEGCPELNPIAPELKEVVWGGAAFAVLLVVMWLWLFPKVREGMRARYDSIQDDRESADTLTASARADVSEYEARLSSVRAEAQQKIDAARSTLESERSEQIGAANERISEKRSAAAAEVEEARQAAMGDIEAAVVDVVSRATEIAVGKQVGEGTVRSAVRDAMDDSPSEPAGASS